jgi:hypothetical protein
MKFTGHNGTVSFYTLFYEVEDDLNNELLVKQMEMDNKRKSYWKEKPKGDGSGSQPLGSQGDSNRIDPKRGRFGEVQGQSHGKTHSVGNTVENQGIEMREGSNIVVEEEANPIKEPIQKNIEIEEIPYSTPIRPNSPHQVVDYDPQQNLAIVTFTPLFGNEKTSEGAQPILDVQPLRQASPPPLSLVPKPAQVTRQSTRLKGKVPVQYVTGSPVPAPHQNRIPLFRAGINSLVDQFP